MTNRYVKFWNDRAKKIREEINKDGSFNLKYKNETPFYIEWNNSFLKEWEKENGLLKFEYI